MSTRDKTEKRKHENVEDTDGVLQEEVSSNISDQKKSKKSKKSSKQLFSQKPSTKDLDGTVADIDKKAKKRKRKDTEGDHKALQSEDNEEEFVQQLPTKKRKNRTEFVDPREDLALNNQTRKALEYAFMQMNKPSKWKFNKARQNWIIRNLWSPETLPEVYLSLTLKYLSKIQGGSRKKLVEEAQTILHPPSNPETSTEKMVKFSEPDIDLIEETTLKAKQVPGPLISTDRTPGPLLDSESMPTTNGPSSDVAKGTLAQVKKMRAQKLLEVLS